MTEARPPRGRYEWLNDFESGKRAFVRGTSADGRMNERTHTLDCAARGLEAPSPALEVEDTAAQIYDFQRSLLDGSKYNKQKSSVMGSKRYTC